MDARNGCAAQNNRITPVRPKTSKGAREESGIGRNSDAPASAATCINESIADGSMGRPPIAVAASETSGGAPAVGRGRAGRELRGPPP